MRAWPDGAEKRLELVDLEHENDAVTHDIVHHLHARLAVPFERSDVLALASGLDDVVDYAEEAADFLGLYRVEAPDGPGDRARRHPRRRRRRGGRRCSPTLRRPARGQATT